MHGDREFNRNVEPRQYDEIAESVKVTMKALKDFFGVRASSKQARLRAVGSEFGHMVARNISNSHDPQVVLGEIASFRNDYGLGEMQIEKSTPPTFTLRNCFDCTGAESGDLLCGFKEGWTPIIARTICRTLHRTPGAITEFDLESWLSELCSREPLGSASPYVSGSFRA